MVAFSAKGRDVGAERVIPCSCLFKLYDLVNTTIAHYPAKCLPRGGVYAVRLATAVPAKILDLK